MKYFALNVLQPASWVGITLPLVMRAVQILKVPADNPGKYLAHRFCPILICLVRGQNPREACINYNNIQVIHFLQEKPSKNKEDNTKKKRQKI